MKFFRKYMKHMLAIFMALLLIVWLGGDALTNLIARRQARGDFEVFQAYGQPVEAADLVVMNNHEQIGSSLMGRAWHVPWAGILRRMVDDQQLWQYRDRLSDHEWYLLDLEARRNGVHVSQNEINELRAALSADAINALRERSKVSIQDIDEALRTYLRVEEAALQALSAVTVSEADIRDFIRNISEKIKVNVVTVDPQKLIDADYQPSEEALIEQFEAYKNQQKGGAGQYGYQLPQATQVEYIEIDVDELAKGQNVTEDEAWNYWNSHQSEFRRPTTQPATSTAPAEEPQPYDTFYEAQDDVRAKLQRDKAVHAASRLANDLIRQLSRPWAEQPTTQPGDYKQPPDSALADDLYENLIAGYQERYPGVLKYGRTQLAPANELATGSTLSQARAFGGTNQPVSFREVAFMVAGLSADQDGNSSRARLFRNVYETAGEPLSVPDGNVYVIRNLEVRPAQPPESFEDVREQLVKDLREIRAGELAEQMAKDLAERAKVTGLKVAFQSDADLATKLGNNALAEPEPFARQMFIPGRGGGMAQVYGGWIPGVGYDPQLSDLAFELADRATTTQPAPVDVHKDSRQRWMVIEHVETIPVTQEEYNKQRDMARYHLLTRKRVQFVLDWFSPESIQARTGWRPANENLAEQQADEATDAENAAS